MTIARLRVLGAGGAAAIAGYALVPDRTAAFGFFGLASVLLALLFAVLVANRDHLDLVWWLQALGLVAVAARASVAYAAPGPELGNARLVLLAVGVGATIAATVRFIALRTNLRDLDGVIDVLMLTCAIGVLLWDFVVRRHLGAGGPLDSAAAVAIFPALQSLALALSVRFMFWGTWRLPSAWLVFGGAVALFAGNVADVVGYDATLSAPGRGAAPLWLVCLLLFVLAAAHRPRAELTRATLPGMSRVPYARLAIMAGGLAAAPAIVIAHARGGATGMVPAVGSFVLTAMIVGRLIRVVVEREKARGEINARSDQQTAVVRLGQRALAGSELARLFDEATQAVAQTLPVDCVGVFEPAGAETLVLRAAVGWTVADSRRTTVSSAEPFFGVPLVAGTAGYLDREHSHHAYDCELLREVNAESGVSVAIGTPAQRYGVLAAVTSSVRRFSADDVTFLRAVANVLTAAIERTRIEDEVRQAALHDPLTGLPNRVLLLDRLESALSRAKRSGTQVAVMFVDLDGFKQVNDTFGHRAGDQLLVAVSRRLDKALRSEDTLARLAGDEFIVICERIEDPDTIAAVAARIVATLQEPFVLDDGTAQISASVGVSVGAGQGDDVDQLLRDADAAMYQAKQAGKSRYAISAADWSGPGRD